MTIFKTYEITVDTIERKKYSAQESEMQTVRFSQNDQNSAKLVLNITQKGVAQDLSAATAVRIAFKKADGKLVYQDCQAVNALTGKYQVVLNTQTLAAMGKVIVQVHIEFTDRKVETQKFAFVVDESLMFDETIESTNEFPALQKAIDAGEKLKGVDIPALIASKTTAEAAQVKVDENANQIGILSELITVLENKVPPFREVYNQGTSEINMNLYSYLTKFEVRSDKTAIAKIVIDVISYKYGSLLGLVIYDKNFNDFVEYLIVIIYRNEGDSLRKNIVYIFLFCFFLIP